MADTLVTTRVVKPGVYIGRINRVAPTGTTGFIRLPCYVGRGSRLRTVFNDPIRRSYLSDVTLAFPTAAPHIVALAQPAVNDQTISRLFRSDGIIVPNSKWQFVESTPGSGVYNEILLAPEAYDANTTYALDYQSTSRLIQDALPFSELREIRFVGDTENQELYTEYTDFFIPITITPPTAAVANAYSSAASKGFSPAEVTGTLPGPFVFGVDTLALNVNGNPYIVPLAGALTVAETVAAINAVISADGVALASGNFVTIRSLSFDPAISAVSVTGGSAAFILGLVGAQFPTFPMVVSGYTTAGHFRKLSGTGSPAVGVRSTSTANHGKNRRYRIAFGAPGVTIPATVSILLDSGAAFAEVAAGGPVSASGFFGAVGSGTQPQLPFHSTVATTATSIAFASPGGVSTFAFTDITGDLVEIILDDTGAVVTGNEIYEVTLVGPSSIDVDSAVANTAQWSSFSAVGTGVLSQTNVATVSSSTTISGALVGTGSVALRANSDYSGLSNRRYALVCTASAGGPGSRTASFAWQSWGEIPVEYNGGTRTFSISEALGTNSNVSLGNGVILDLTFGASNFAVDDTFFFQANANRIFVTAKDNRHYILDVAAIGTDGSGNNTATFTFQSGTPEGSFGLQAVTGAGGDFFLASNIRLRARNIGAGTTTSNRFVVGDEWTFDTVSSDVIDWSLTSRLTETISTTQFYTDVLGVITGTVGLKYVVLQHVPTSILYIRDTVTNALLSSYSIPQPTQPYVAFTTAPTNPIEIRYEYIGAEPSPGNIYYVTANTLRPLDLYETPIKALSYDEAAQILGPSATTNDLLIMAQLALDDNNAFGAYFCQARDIDGDGVVTTVDINRAIKATEDNHTMTDVIVLNSFNSLSAALSNNEKMNDPFLRAERALWVGAPVGTRIGDTDTPGTLVYLATRTLQVSGENPAHGTRVLVGNVAGTKTITLTDGTNIKVNLDGSFIAGAFAARNAGFEDPGETLLRKNLFGFDSIDVYSEPNELQLNAASIVWVSNQGSDTTPIYRIEESTTVDRSSDDNNEISVAINQKQYVTREIRTDMDASLISIVPPSEQAGVAIIQTFLVEKLQSLVARGIIGAYQDENGNARPIDPNTDVEVFRSRDSRTLYVIKYYWYGRYPVKRIFGTYSVDRKFFGQSV